MASCFYIVQHRSTRSHVGNFCFRKPNYLLIVEKNYGNCLKRFNFSCSVAYAINFSYYLPLELSESQVEEWGI